MDDGRSAAPTIHAAIYQSPWRRCSIVFANRHRRVINPATFSQNETFSHTIYLSRILRFQRIVVEYIVECRFSVSESLSDFTNAIGNSQDSGPYSETCNNLKLQICRCNSTEHLLSRTLATREEKGGILVEETSERRRWEAVFGGHARGGSPTIPCIVVHSGCMRAPVSGGNRFTRISIIVIKHAASMNYLSVGRVRRARRR